MVSSRGWFKRWRTYLTAVLLLLLDVGSWQPQYFTAQALTPNFPPLSAQDSGKAGATVGDKATKSKANQRPVEKDKTRDNNNSPSKYHTSDFGAKQNHPSSYDPTPPFLGPIRLEPLQGTGNDGDGGPSQRSFHMGRERIQRYYQRHNLLGKGTAPLTPSSPTKQKLKAIVDHLAYHNAPVDVKEVCESIEFVLRTRKRLLGAAKQQQQQKQRQGGNEAEAENTSINLYDLCCGHGLTGMLFCCCHDTSCMGPKSTSLTVFLVDRKQPSSHSILRELLVQVCPWVGTSNNTISFHEASLDSYTTLAGLSLSNKDFVAEESASTTDLVISTHACGSLTDRVLELASNSMSHTASKDNTDTPDDNRKNQVAAKATAVAVMPCCYTGTSQGAPFGIQRALGVAWAADIQRSYYLQSKGYHVDYANIPREITPMNRILIGEYRGTTP